MSVLLCAGVPKLSFLLETALVATEGDSLPVGQAKKVTADYLRQRYPLNGLHYAATLLDPRYKGLRFISPATRQGIHAEALAFLRKHSSTAEENDATPEVKPEEKAPKKRTAFEDFIAQVGYLGLLF